MYCKKCGKQIDDDAVFCPFCGSKQKNESNVSETDTGKRKISFDGEIIKCPNCGEVLKSFETVCPSCGYELRNSRKSKAIDDFSKKMVEIEAKRKEKTKFQTFADAFKNDHLDNIDNEKINLIRSYAVPNNKEDICEFLIMACSNIDESVALNENASYALKAINEAWVAKASQVYNKAVLSFGNDSSFKEVEKIYNDKIASFGKANKKRKRSSLMLGLGLFGFIIIMIVVIIVMSMLEKQGII